MKLREWFQNHPIMTAILNFIILSISVGIIYLSVVEVLTLNELFIGLGMSSIAISLLSYVIRCILASIALFLLIPLVFYQRPRNFLEYTREISLVKGISLLKTILCGFLSFLIYLIVAISPAMALGIFTDTPFIFLRAPGDGKAGWLLLLAAINPGFFEEIGFRGVLFTNLEKKYSGWIVVLISALFFGLFHFGNLIVGEDPITVFFLVVMATMFGLSWGYTRLKTKSVIPSMIAHYLIDALSEGFLSPNTTDQTKFGIFMIGLIILYPILSMIATKIVFLSYDKKTKAQNSQKILSQS